MNAQHRNLSRSALAALVLSAFASAQIGTLILPAGIGDDPRCVHAIGNGHVVISNQVDGWQHFVNVSVPSAPTLTTSLNPPGGDQWFEAEYVPDYGGRLFTAHRGGGINMIDVSTPWAPATLATVPTVYHFRGLRYQRDGANGVLYYNATNQGLGVYTVTNNATTLSATPVWDNYTFNSTNDGNGLERIGSELYQFGTPANNPTARMLKGFNVATPTAPVQNFFASYSNQVGGHTQLRRSLLPAARLFASRGADGLEVFDTTVPTALVSYPLLTPISGLTMNCWGTVSFPGSPFAITYGSIWATNNPSVKYQWWLLLTVPPVGAPSAGPIIAAPLDTHDITVDANSGRVYVVGRNSAGQGVLYIY